MAPTKKSDTLKSPQFENAEVTKRPEPKKGQVSKHPAPKKDKVSKRAAPKEDKISKRPKENKATITKPKIDMKTAEDTVTYLHVLLVASRHERHLETEKLEKYRQELADKASTAKDTREREWYLKEFKQAGRGDGIAKRIEKCGKEVRDIVADMANELIKGYRLDIRKLDGGKDLYKVLKAVEGSAATGITLSRAFREYQRKTEA